jgi:hypothetical protein
MTKQVFASSGTIDGIKKLTAEFYCNTVERILFYEFPVNEYFVSIDNWQGSGIPKKLDEVKVYAKVGKRTRFTLETRR